MSLKSYETMDVHLLVGLINTALRNDCENLEDLVKTHDLDQTILLDRLKSIGLTYRKELNQFRAD